MSFTALHRALGFTPGPLTDDLPNAAVAADVVETEQGVIIAGVDPARGR